ncbi:unnamed protein product [Spirodela intermedia]|uniref:Uncharacterized protein n=1 Tax=Spirodela intermedia TaxID=51605 RepID=A0A7I8KQA2_SPIIN|nr:unnamed protein product [Spirodela intermedia]
MYPRRHLIPPPFLSPPFLFFSSLFFISAHFRTSFITSGPNSPFTSNHTNPLLVDDEG